MTIPEFVESLKPFVAGLDQEDFGYIIVHFFVEGSMSATPEDLLDAIDLFRTVMITREIR
ncbi:MAG: hypothetical protein AB1646_14090 [Thermodesulfobacteriota bacterium]